MADPDFADVSRYFLEYPGETYTVTIGSLKDINGRTMQSQSHAVKVTGVQAAFIAQFLQLRNAPDVTSE